jgi:VWFA-related protein
MNHLKLLSLLVLLLLPCLARAQNDDDVVRFKTNLVQLDVVAVDESGKQVKGLTAADFKIIDNGRERVPEFITYVSFAEQRPNELPVKGHPSAEQLGRVFVFVVSNPVIHFALSFPGTNGGPSRTTSVSNLGTAIRAADSAQKFLTWFVDKQLSDADLAAIASTDADLGVLSSFTNDRLVLHAAMHRVHESVKGTGLNLTVVGREISLQSLASLNLRVMDTLENVIKQVETLPGRKVVTLLSGGLLYNPRLPYYQAISERLDRLVKKANESRVAIYTLHTRDLDFNISFRANDGLLQLAQRTGGRALYNTNDLSVAFDQVIEENRGYYLLAYDPGAEANARPVDLQVRVNRSGVKVLARAEGLAQKTTAAKTQLAVSPFLSPLSANEIGLQISSALAAEKRGEVLTSCRVDLSQVTTRANGDGRQNLSLGLSIRVTGPDGRDFKKADRDLSFDVTDAELETSRRDGVLSTFSFAGEKPGFYRISVAVRDNHSGRVGNSRVFVEVKKKDLNKN